MYVRPGSDTKAVILARMDRIEAVTEAIGCDTDRDRADLTHTSERQWGRARAGEPVGDRFVASLLTSLRRFQRTLTRRKIAHDFDALFYVDVLVLPHDEDAA